MSMGEAVLMEGTTTNVLTDLAKNVVEMYSGKCETTATTVYTYAFPENEVEVSLERIWKGQAVVCGVDVHMTGSAKIKMSKRDPALEERITAAIHVPIYANIPGRHSIVRKITILDM